MSFVLGILAAAGAVALSHLLFGLGDLPRPWSTVVLGVIGGLTLGLVRSAYERARIRRAGAHREAGMRRIDTGGAGTGGAGTDDTGTGDTGSADGGGAE